MGQRFGVSGLWSSRSNLGLGPTVEVQDELHNVTLSGVSVQVDLQARWIQYGLSLELRV